MDNSAENLRLALEQEGALSLVQNAVDIAIAEHNGDDCKCSVSFAKMLEDLGIDACIVKKVIIYGRNRIKVRRQNRDLENVFPAAEFLYPKQKDGTPICNMLCIHFVPSEEIKRYTGIYKLVIEKTRFLYNVIVGYTGEIFSSTNPFTVSLHTDLFSLLMPKISENTELPKFCAERRSSYKKLLDKSYLTAAFQQCINEIKNGCEECPVASNYGPKHECPYFQLKLSEFYQNGEIVPRDEIIAFNWIRKAAIQGLQDAEFIYAHRLSQGNGSKRDIEKAFEVYSRLAMKGHKESAQELAHLYDNESPLAYRRVPWMVRLAKSGNHEIQSFLIEQVYSKGALGIQPDDTLLSKWVEIAAETGNVECVEKLIHQYEVSSDWGAALKWACRLQELRPEEDYSSHINELFVKTLEGKDVEYVLKKADDYYVGIDTEIDYNKAFLCYSSIDEDSAEAMFGKARCYEYGRGTRKDTELADEMYLLSAENGSVRAIEHMYEKSKDASDDNPWTQKFISALDAGVEQNNIYALLIKARLLIYPEEELFLADKAEAFNLYNRAMELGSAEAIRGVGMCLCDGHGVDVDYDKAQELFNKAAERGVKSAMRCLGCTFQKGRGKIEKDGKAAFQWYLQAANREDAHSQYVLGKHYEKRNSTKSIEWYMRAAENGNSQAKAKMIEKLFYGNEIKKDLVLARKWGEEAAAEGERDVYFRVAYMCCDGIGGAKDYQKAIKYYSILAEDNNAAAINNLGWMTACGKGVEKDSNKAVELYRKAAELGDKVAMRNLAIYYEQGTGVEKDYSKYLEWMKKGAESGNIQCMYELAVLYKNGDSENDVDIDIDNAIRYYENIVAKSATDDDNKTYYQNALMALANIYYQGEGVEINDEKALSLHRKAAESGIVKAYYMLGEHYYYGYGTEEDEKMAIFWYRKAAEKDYEEAKEKLDELGVDYLPDDDDEDVVKIGTTDGDDELPF